MMQREMMEWTSTWWERTGEENNPRVLMIGDSIVAGYRPEVQKAIGEEICVDQFATSKFADDPFFIKELSLYLEAYPYACIHFNHGLHDLDFSAERYEAAYEKVLNMLLAVCPKVILALSTPMTCNGDPTTLHEKNSVVEERNEIVRGLAEKYQLPVDDLYTPMLGHPEYRCDDGYHYLDCGREVQGRMIADLVRRELAR